MKHRFGTGVRLVSPPARLFHMILNRGNPRAWAAYHTVPERRGTLWVHCHGLQWRGAANLEITGVPAKLRDEAIELMFGLVRIARSRRGLKADEDFAERLSARGQQFAQLGSIRSTGRNDRQHNGMLRVVDYGQSLADGFPMRLFAAHLVARAGVVEDPKWKETLYRQALEVFPGEYAEFNEGADTDPADGDFTELQHKFNICGWYGLAELLRDQGRSTEAFVILADAMAHCPGWAGVYRNFLLHSGGKEDQYFRFWRDVDINDLAAQRRPAVTATVAAARPVAVGAQSRGFGNRPVDPLAELQRRG